MLSLLQRSASWEPPTKPFLCTCSQCSHARDSSMEAEGGLDACSSKAETGNSLPMAFTPSQGNRGFVRFIFFKIYRKLEVTSHSVMTQRAQRASR